MTVIGIAVPASADESADPFGDWLKSIFGGADPPSAGKVTSGVVDYAKACQPDNQLPMWGGFDLWNKKERFVQFALSQVGYHEGKRINNGASVRFPAGNNWTKYGVMYGNYVGEWCAVFVSVCAEAAGIPENVLEKSASASIGMYNSDGTKSSKYIPRENALSKAVPVRGDLVYFLYRRSGDRNASHVGIVVGYNKWTHILETVEGNKSNAVKKCSYNLETNKTIKGFLRVDV
jgi:hypothetical protein